jgi:ABC-type multidrug transport system fused ATPase/permease subunit
MKNFLRIISILDKKEKKNFFLIILLSFLNSILDLLSIGFIYPLTAAILKINNNIIIEKINVLITDNLNINIVNFYLTLIISLFILRNIFNILFFTLLNNFLKKNFNRNIETSVKSHLSIGFQEFISQTYSKFYNNIINENINLKNYISTSINLFSEILLIISLIGLIFIINSKIASHVLITFSVFLIIYTFFFTKKTKSWGLERNKIIQNITKVLLETYNSIRDIKILDKENFFINKIKILSNSYSFLQYKYETLLSINRNMIEFFILLLVSIVLFFIEINDQLYNLIPLISLYVLCFFRIYPSINRITNNITTIKFYQTGIETFSENRIILDSPKNIQLSKFNFSDQLELKNISFKYNNSEDYVIEDANIKIKKNEIVGMIGKNGSGKSTVCNLLLGLLKPQKGSIIIDNKLDINKNYVNYRKMLSFVPQKIYLINDTIKKNIMFGSEDEEINNFNVDKIKNFSKLLSFALDSNGELLDYNIGEDGSLLSGGQKQRVAIARALYKESEILIMDEPNNNLDIETENKIIEDLVSSSIKRTIIIISHNKNSLKFCDNIIEIKNKKLTYVH